jgi:hypothetical protein
MSTAVALKAGGSIAGIVPQNVEEVFRLAKCIEASGLAPKDMNSAEKITVAILTGLEIGLPPIFAIQKIAVINGRPSIWGDAVPALLWSRGFKIDEQTDEVKGVAMCMVTRPDGTKITRTFSKEDAKKANLLSKPGPWTLYPFRMLAMRARGYACRDGAADVLGGLYLKEEAEDIIDITPTRKSSSAAKKDGTSELFNTIRGEIQNAPTREMLEHVRDIYTEDWDVMPTRWAELLNNEYEDKEASFIETPEAQAAE